MQYTAILKEERLLCRSEQGDLSGGCAICVALCPRATIRCWHGVHSQVIHVAWLLCRSVMLQCGAGHMCACFSADVNRMSCWAHWAPLCIPLRAKAPARLRARLGTRDAL